MNGFWIAAFALLLRNRITYTATKPEKISSIIPLFFSVMVANYRRVFYSVPEKPRSEMDSKLLVIKVFLEANLVL